MESGDEINLILDEKSLKHKNDPIEVDLKQNVVVAHPDLLISGTTVSNGLGCLRRAVLSERFKVVKISFIANKPNNSLGLFKKVVC